MGLFVESFYMKVSPSHIIKCNNVSSMLIRSHLCPHCDVRHTMISTVNFLSRNTSQCYQDKCFKIFLNVLNLHLQSLNYPKWLIWHHLEALLGTCKLVVTTTTFTLSVSFISIKRKGKNIKMRSVSPFPKKDWKLGCRFSKKRKSP